MVKVKVEQFRYGEDNLAYIVHGERLALAIDGGAWEEILHFLDRQGLVLSFITNTHNHYDHTSGNHLLLRHTKAEFLRFDDLPDQREIVIDGEKIIVYRTPGHTSDSVSFYTGQALITGDTLFNGTIGNCFSGNLKKFYLSIKRLMALPPETLVYAGHDYVGDSLAFAEYLEPQNADIKRFRAAYDPDHVYSTLADEFRINPYCRFNEEPIVSLLKGRGLPCGTEWERWESLMSIE
jgi:hydroxyacylglutathione hydrolase